MYSPGWRNRVHVNSAVTFSAFFVLLPDGGVE